MPASHEGGTKKDGRKTLVPRLRDCDLSSLDSHRGLRYPGIGSLSEYEPILKIFAIYFKFSAVQSITGIDRIRKTVSP